MFVELEEERELLSELWLVELELPTSDGSVSEPISLEDPELGVEEVVEDPS